jgi:predicted lysophospholipase L1 biosynthesis ABC-type transport system permease subunit
MTIWRLVLREIGYHKLNFALALLAVVVAVGALSAVTTLLRLYDLETEQLVAAREQQTQEEMRLLKDDYRKITRDLGYNLRIFHEDQDAAAFHRDRFASHYMPEDYADQLAKARVITVNHLLPILHEYLTWPELGQPVHVIGTAGEVPIVGGSDKKPIIDAIPKASIILGSEAARQLRVKQGDLVQFFGRSFTVRRVHGPLGTEEDVTVWLPLREAQQLLHKEGKINVILALECNCESKNRIDDVRKEVVKVLPRTQVVELKDLAEVRARARNEAEATAKAAVEQIRGDREKLRAGRASLAGIVLAVVLMSSTVWLGGLVFSNVRDRRSEIGILRSLGVGSRRVAALVLTRSLLLGLIGALVGCAVGVGVGVAWAGAGTDWTENASGLWPLAVLLVAAPLWCAVASLMPAIVAARQDPAVILSE